MGETPLRRGTRWPHVTAAVVVLAFVASVVVTVAAQAGRGGLTGDEMMESLGLLAAFGAFSLTGALLIARRPSNAVGWLVAAVGLLSSLFHPLDLYAAHVLGTRGDADLLTVLALWGQSWWWFAMLGLVLVFLPLLFPDGRLPSPRWRPLAAVPVVTTLLIVALAMLSPTIEGRETDLVLDNPIGIAGMPDVEADLGFLFLGMLVGIPLGIASLVVRFRRSHRIERQQIKVFLTAVTLLLLLPLSEFLAPTWSNLLFPLVVGAIPVAIGVAVLRHRLYDIDRVISRTLAYTLLTVALVGVYAAGVLGVGALLPTGGGDLVVAGSTLAVAALFRPLRIRIQSTVDRRFNRASYDARRTAERFGQRLRLHLDPDALAAELRAAATATVQPADASLWLRDRPEQGDSSTLPGHPQLLARP